MRWVRLRIQVRRTEDKATFFLKAWGGEGAKNPQQQRSDDLIKRPHFEVSFLSNYSHLVTVSDFYPALSATSSAFGKLDVKARFNLLCVLRAPSKVPHSTWFESSSV
jgi:hypothetical protein